MRKLLLCCILLIAAIQSGFSQTQTVSGTVLDKSSMPIEGVTVVNLDNNKTTTTDNKGRFTLPASIGQSIRFGMVGAESITRKLTTLQSLTISLELTETNLNDVVVTGYTTERKKDLTGAVTVVKMADIQNIPLGNPIKALQGRVPGIVVSSNGSPNGAVTVRMRGQTTLNISNDPLYVIDGIPTQRGLQELNQNDIESIQVLKDASAASIYGSRAAAGVIIVTTKRGKLGSQRLDIDASNSLQFYDSKLSLLNTDQRARAYWQAAVNDSRFGPSASNPRDPSVLSSLYDFDWNLNYQNPILNRVILPEFIDAEKTMRASDTRWIDVISQTSVIQQYNIAASNATEKGAYYLSLGLYDNQGIIKGSRSRKATLKMNVDHNFFNKRLTIGENLNASYFKDSLTPTTEATDLARILNPILPVYTESGGYSGPVAGMDDRNNPLRIIEDNRQNNNNFGRIISSTYLNFKIIDGLNFRSAFNVDYAGSYKRTLQVPYKTGFLQSDITQVNTSFDFSGSITFQNTITYDKQFKDHRLNVLLGSENISNNGQAFDASARGLAIANIDYAYLSRGTSNILANGSGGADALQSFFGKVNYSFKDRYLLSATLRRDGSSKFGENNRFAYFPAASFGWRISEEAFVKNNLPSVSDMKVRLSWGQTGNQSIPAYATSSLYQAIYGSNSTWDPSNGSAYDIYGAGSGTLPSGFTATQTGNPNLKWETTTQSNIGLDFGLFDNSLSGSVDYYIKDTKNILISPPYIGTLGEGGNTYINGASLRNKGLEAILSYSKSLGKDFNVNVTGNISRNVLNITSLPNASLNAYPGNGTTYTIIGRSPNTFFGYVADGIFQSASEVSNSAAQPGKGLGRIRYKDLNGDGIINNNDQEYLGKSDPDFIYGLNIAVNYKRFDLALFFQGVQGGLVNNTYKGFTDFTSLSPNTNWGTRLLNAWTPENPTSAIPALSLSGANNENRFSTYYLETANYLKLRNVQLGYDLKDALKMLKVSRAKIYLQASNLMRFKSKSYTAPDPENPGNAFPIPVITSLGFNLSF